MIGSNTSRGTLSTIKVRIGTDQPNMNMRIQRDRRENDRTRRIKTEPTRTRLSKQGKALRQLERAMTEKGKMNGRTGNESIREND